MPDITDVVFVDPDMKVFVPPPPLSLQFRHQTVAGVSTEEDTIEFPWYWTRLDHSALNGKPNAIVTVTTVGRIEVNEEARTATLVHNPHPVGVVYRDATERWYIYNLGFEAMALRADFHVAVHEDRRD